MFLKIIVSGMVVIHLHNCMPLCEHLFIHSVDEYLGSFLWVVGCTIMYIIANILGHFSWALWARASYRVYLKDN